MTLSEENFINIHSHFKAKIPKEWVLRNAFDSLSFEQISNLKYNISVGIHPWHIYQNIDNQLDKLKQIAQHPKVLAIGEMGIDRKTNTPIDLQKQVFEAQIILANELKKPVIIHAVRSYEDILPFIKKYPSVNFIFHAYSGNEFQTTQFIKCDNVFFSFGKSIFEANESKIKVFNELPLERIFLETDNSHFTISEIYKQASFLKNISLELLQKTIYTNFEAVFSVNT